MMRKVCLLVVIFSLFTCNYSFAQNAMRSADGWGNGWTTNDSWSATGFGNVYGKTYTNSLGGGVNRYFRLYSNYGSCNNEYGPDPDYEIIPGMEYEPTAYPGTNKAYFISNVLTTEQYVFRTKYPDNCNYAGQKSLIVFRISGTPVTVSSVSQTPGISAVAANQSVTVTANLSGALPTGQGVYLRYTTDNWTTATLIPMAGSGTIYTANIPSNITGTVVKYYVLTSGSGVNPGFSDVDWYTINANTNGGAGINGSGGPNFSYIVGGPVYVNATAATSEAVYSTLKGAFDAINSGTHQGAISISIYDNTTETASASLNASGSGSANYSGISIQPAGGGARTISGDIAGAPLIDLNGADNLSINGLNDGTNSLTISNTSTSNVSQTSTIRFINDATNNTITNCIILGSSTASLSANAGTIFFSTALSSSSSGNDNNSISYCNIGPAGSNFPNRAIHAQGTYNTLNAYNNNISIANCNIYNFFDGGGSSRGIYIDDGNSDWIINGNKIYQTALRAWTTSGTVYVQRAIAVIQSLGLGSNFQINSNIIGYSSFDGTGTYSLTGYTNKFIGIDLKTGSATVQGNIIAGINQNTTAQNNATFLPPFIGIYAESGTISISSNQIGNSTSPITFFSSNASANDVYGIYGSTNTTISGNSIDNISITSTTSPTTFSAIRGNTSSDINSNLIGLNASLSSSATSGKIIGIYLESGSPKVYANKIASLSSVNSIVGIGVYGATSTIYNNFISLGTGITSATTISGIEHSSGASPSIYYNSVRLQGTASSGAANSYALFAGSGLSLTVKDNIFYNERTGGTGQHNAIRLGNGVSYAGDYNDLYQTSGTTTGNINGTNYAALTDWKTGSGQDANSISASVPFTSATDLHLNDPALSSAVLNKGIDIPSITTDIDGDKRRPGCNGTDIGADELYLYSSLSSTSKVWLGKSGTNWCDDCNWESQAVPTSSDNVIIQTFPFGNNPVVATGCTANANDLSINSSSLTVSGGILNVYGNFTNSATFTNSAGTVNFSGSAAQTISSVTDLSFYNLTFSGGGAKNIGVNTTVNGSLGLSNGIVNMSSGKNMILPAGIGYTGGSSSSYINGTLRKYFALSGESSFKYPVGDATHYGPFELNNISGVTTGDYLDGSYSTGVAPGAHHNILNPVNASPSSSGTNSSVNTVFSSYVEYWNLGFPVGSNDYFKAQVTLYYTNNLFSQLYNKGADWLRVTSWSGVSGGGADGYFDWGNANPLADESSGSSGSISTPVQLGASALNTVFTFGTTANGVNPLPVLIKSFTATKETGYNKLNWSAACPGSDLTFEVLRSTDGKNFQMVNKITASETRCNQPFDFNDYNATGDKIYYRIKITDKYGKVTYTQVAVLFNERIGLVITGLMPNPVTDRLYLTISSAAKDKIQLTVSDLNGRQIMKLSSLLFAGNNTISIPVKNMAKGIYNISGSISSGQIITQRFIKQ